MKSYCVKQKKQTECVSGSEKFVTAKNGRNMMKCTCAECGITKTKFIKSKEGGNLFDFMKHFNPKETYDAVKKNKVPYLVDFSKGFSLLKDSFKPNPVSKETAKKMVARYKREYKAYKNKGGTKSCNKWILDKGYGTKPAY